MKLGRNSDLNLIKFNSRNIRFPQLCPICGNKATRYGLLFSTVIKPDWKSRNKHNSGSKSPQRTGNENKRIIRLRIPVCDDHFSITNTKPRVVALMTFIGGISAMGLLLLSTIIAFNIYDGNDIGLFPIFWATMLSSTIISWRVLASNELEEVISVSDLSVANTYWVIRVKHNWYRDELLRLNPRSAQVPRYEE